MNGPVIMALPPQREQAAGNPDGYAPRALLSGAIAAASVHLQSASEHIANGNADALVASMRQVMSCAKVALGALPEAVDQIQREGGL